MNLPPLFSLGLATDRASDIIATTSGPMALFHQNRYGMWVRTSPVSGETVAARAHVDECPYCGQASCTMGPLCAD